ncbi:MAG: hypothetical protein WD066_01390 [Planctomycetaceae bacterium]
MTATNTGGPSCYINTCLDLVSRHDLSPLAGRFDAEASLMYCDRYGDGKWYAGLSAKEAGDREVDRKPEDHIRELLDIVARFDERETRVWYDCEKREFNIGWQAAVRRPEGAFTIPVDVLHELARHDATLALTIYPSCENDFAPPSPP